MGPEQAKLSTTLGAFIGEISALDWRIAITSTDMIDPSEPGRGQLVPMVGSRKYLRGGGPDTTDDDPTPAATFQSKVVLGDQGDGKEQGIRASLHALTINSEAAEWIRPEAQLAIIVLSDEDECSNQYAICYSDGQPVHMWNDENEYINLFQSIRDKYGPKKNVTFNAIVTNNDIVPEPILQKLAFKFSKTKASRALSAMPIWTRPILRAVS